MADNFDSEGFSTGLVVGQMVNDFGMQLLVNRKQVFQNALKAPSFRQSVILQLSSLRTANVKAAVELIDTVRPQIEKEVQRAHKAGVSNVDKAVNTSAKKGYEAPKTPTENVGLTQRQINIIIGIVTTFTSMAASASISAEEQAMQIATQVNENAEDLVAQFDQAQTMFLDKGFAGSVTSDGREIEIESQAEFVIRDQTHKQVLDAQGERAQEYGLQPLVQISSHPSCCPLCRPFQNKILVDDVYQGGKPDGKHELLSSAISAGLFHFNCRHEMINYIEGYDRTNLFEKETLDARETAKRYAYEQQQRQNERMIREYKRRAAGMLDETKQKLAQQKVQEWQARQRALQEIAKNDGVTVYRQYAREQIGGATKPTLPRQR